MPRCFLGLGGNLGSVPTTFRKAVERLHAAGCLVQAVSRSYRTMAVGPDAGGDFLNAAVAIETHLAPPALLELLQQIETGLGRTRAIHWGPRTIDLDLILYGDAIIDAPRLAVPHPCAWYRRFVLDPLSEIAPQVVHPVKQMTILQLRDRLLVRPFRVALAGRTEAERAALITRLAHAFPAVRFSHWDDSRSRAPEPPVLLFRLRSPTGTAESEKDERLFESLPALPRLAVPRNAPSPLEFMRLALEAALGEPVVDERA